MFFFPKLFSEFLRQSGSSPDFENMDDAQIAESLRRFYGGVRPKKGEDYSKTALINMRYGIQRFLQSPPNHRSLSLTKDPIFLQANKVLEGKIALLKKAGKDKTTHKEAINVDDMRKLYESLNMSEPTGLQDKVFLDIMLHFGRRGREGLSNMTKETFEIRQDPSGVEYVTINHNEYDKNHKKIEHEDKQQIMFAAPGDPLCPILSFKKYMSVLNPKQTKFWQRPKPQGKGFIWYDNSAIGKNKIAKMLSRMSERAELSMIYTNHSLKATSATVLKEAGVTNKDICSVTGHRNPSSLDSYVRAPNLKRRHEMSNILHQHKKIETSSQETLSLPAPPTHTSMQRALALPAPSSHTMTTNHTLNTLHQDLPAMFQGATFNAPLTITINYNVAK